MQATVHCISPGEMNIHFLLLVEALSIAAQNNDEGKWGRGGVLTKKCEEDEEIPVHNE